MLFEIWCNQQFVLFIKISGLSIQLSQQIDPPPENEHLWLAFGLIFSTTLISDLIYYKWKSNCSPESQVGDGPHLVESPVRLGVYKFGDDELVDTASTLVYDDELQVSDCETQVSDCETQVFDCETQNISSITH